MSNRPWGPQNGPRSPMGGSPPLDGVVFRRTSTVDVLRPDGLQAGLTVRAVGRDLLCSAGDRSVIEAGWANVEAGADRRVIDFRTSLTTDLASSPLVGQQLGRGFRRVALDGVGADGVVRLLLDDVGVVALLAGYVEIYNGRAAGAGFVNPDICAGWVDGGVLVSAVRSTGDVPLPQGPVAPQLASDDGGWHPVPVLPRMGLRRSRRIDTALVDGNLVVDAMFRDSFVDSGGEHRVIHEYSLFAEVDADGLVVREIEAVPRVLPWIECPGAALSVEAMVGARADQLRSTVDESLRGVSTCTHLNSLARALGAPIRRAIDSSLLNM